MSTFLVGAVLVFLAVASSVLVWEGLAGVAGRGRAAGGALRRERLRLATGVAVFAIVLWIAFGLVTHAH